jgi:hypothetical protein
MRVRFAWLKWVVTLAVLAGLLVPAWLFREQLGFDKDRDEPGEERKKEQGIQPTLATGKISEDYAESHGIKVEPAVAVRWAPRPVFYGNVVANPHAVVELRSPFAGTLRGDAEKPWPALGKSVQGGQVLGHIDVRLGPQERLDFQAKLTEARSKLQGVEETLKLHQDRLERLQKFGTADVVSRRELDEALFQAAETRTQRAMARAAVDLWLKAVNTAERAKGQPGLPWSEALTAPAGGEVTEVLCRPGMNIESGAVIARVVDPARVLVRVHLPLETPNGPPRGLELSIAGAPGPRFGPGDLPVHSAVPSVSASLVGPALQIDAPSQLAAYWYEVEPQSFPKNVSPTAWRPGLFVRAQPVGERDKQEGARDAVAVPRLAVLYHLGRAVVYVKLSPGRYQRRLVEVLGADGDRWVLGSGVEGGEAVVSRQAQVLLSEEFRPSDVDID